MRNSSYYIQKADVWIANNYNALPIWLSGIAHKARRKTNVT